MAENEAVPEGQEGPPQPQPEAPQAEPQQPQYEYDPDLVRSQYEEVRRREHEATRREREIEKREREASRPRYSEPPVESMDPQVAYLARMIQEDRAERQQEREERNKQIEEQRELERVGRDLYSSFSVSARAQGMSADQIKKEWEPFTDLVTQFYPDQSMLRVVGADQAVRNVMQFWKSNGGRNSPPQTITTRVTPRTPVITSQGSGPIEDRADTGPQRQGESNTDYAQRVLRNFESLGLKGMSLRDGDKISSE